MEPLKDDDAIAGLDRESREALDTAKGFLSALRIVQEVEAELIEAALDGKGKNLPPAA